MEPYKKMWLNQPIDKLVKFLFIIDNGDITTYSNSTSKRQLNELQASETLRIYSDILSSKNKEKFSSLIKQLEKRAKHLMSHQVILIPENKDAQEISISADDQNVLTFVAACLHLKIPCPELLPQYEKMKEKIGMKEHVNPEFFIYAENLRTVNICNLLTPMVVLKVWKSLNENRDLNNKLEKTVNKSLDNIDSVPGLKDVLFLYMVRYLELQNRLNRLYTHHLESCLEDALQELESDVKQQNGCESINKALDLLNSYPIAHKPTGFCLLLCVTKNRPGAENEADNLNETFINLGYHVKQVINPESRDIGKILEDLDKVRYNFYDSFVLWVIAHGEENHVILADHSCYLTKDLIEDFSLNVNFRKKPKLFFLATCKGSKFIPLKQKSK